MLPKASNAGNEEFDEDRRDTINIEERRVKEQCEQTIEKMKALGAKVGME